MDYNAANNMTIEQAVQYLGLAEDEMTVNTYLYYNKNGYVCSIQLRDRTAQPQDEWFSYGWLASHEGYEWLTEESLRDRREQAVRIAVAEAAMESQAAEENAQDEADSLARFGPSRLSEMRKS